jgi:copper chaperone CopZ
MSKIIKTKFKISGMNCGSCAMNIDFELEDLTGVISVKTSYAKGETELEFDEDKIDIQTVTGKIKDLGYEVSLQ